MEKSPRFVVVGLYYVYDNKEDKALRTDKPNPMRAGQPGGKNLLLKLDSQSEAEVYVAVLNALDHNDRPEETLDAEIQDHRV